MQSKSVWRAVPRRYGVPYTPAAHSQSAVPQTIRPRIHMEMRGSGGLPRDPSVWLLMRRWKCQVKLINQRQADVAVIGECGWNPGQRLNMPSKFWNVASNSLKIHCWMSAWTSCGTLGIYYRYKYYTDSRTQSSDQIRRSHRPAVWINLTFTW